MPFPLLLLVTGVLTGVLGSIIGIPALRLSGLYLALITLMAAGAITLLLKVVQVPQRRQRVLGLRQDASPSGSSVLFPARAIALGDIAYFRYSLVVVSLMFLLVTWHIKGKPGRAWAAIRQSQVTAVSAGVNTTLYKLWAFALSAFITGVAGALLAAGPGGVSVNQFPVERSIILLAVVLMGGVYIRLGRRRRRVPAADPAPPARAEDRAPVGGADDAVRARRDPGAPHHAGWHRVGPGAAR